MLNSQLNGGHQRCGGSLTGERHRYDRTLSHESLNVTRTICFDLTALVTLIDKQEVIHKPILKSAKKPYLDLEFYKYILPKLNINRYFTVHQHLPTF